MKVYNLSARDSLRGRRLKGKGKGALEKGVLGARKTRGAREEGGRETLPLLPPPSRVVSRPNSLSLPFRTPATQAKLEMAGLV